MMELREWQAGDLEMLKEWAREDPLVARMVGVNGRSPSEGTLDASMPVRGVVMASDEPVSIVGMQMFGPSVAAVHVIGSPEHRNYKDQSRAYDVALEYAADKGVVVAIGLIPADNKAAQMMALRKGFQVVPTVLMAKVLPDGN